jgi:site-specific recombinase XerD
MDPLGRDPLIRSFERHLYAENRSARTVTTYLIAVRQADAFLRGRGTSLAAATRGDLEAFMGDLLARRTASTAATYHKVLRILYGWLAEEEDHPQQPMAKIEPELGQIPATTATPPLLSNNARGALLSSEELV